MKFEEYLKEEIDPKDFIVKSFKVGKTGIEVDVILGVGSVPMLDYLKTDEMHGITRKEAEKYKHTVKDGYVGGLGNINLKDNNKPFIYLDLMRISEIGILHECMHVGRIVMTAISDGNKTDNLHEIDYVTLNDENEEEYNEITTFIQYNTLKIC